MDKLKNLEKEKRKINSDIRKEKKERDKRINRLNTLFYELLLDNKQRSMYYYLQKKKQNRNKCEEIEYALLKMQVKMNRNLCDEIKKLKR